MEIKENDHSIEFSQNFSVPVDVLYAAWTEQDQLKQWWHPMEDSLISVKNELNEGGAVEYEFEKKEFQVTGTYESVKPEEQLIYTWNWKFFNDLPDEAYKLTIGFESENEGSILHVKQEGLPGEDAAQPHQEAWKISLESLKSHLDNSSDTSNLDLNGSVKSDEGMNDRSGGYNELPEQSKVGGA